MKTMDGYDDCFIGIVERYGQDPIACYDFAKVIERNMKGGMTREEALEFFEYNQKGAWVGEDTPCFITLAPIKEIAIAVEKSTISNGNTLPEKEDK